MAPIAVEPTQPVPTTASKQEYKGYKEAFNNNPATYNTEIETKGSETLPPAKYPHYLPVWEFET